MDSIRDRLFLVRCASLAVIKCLDTVAALIVTNAWFKRRIKKCALVVRKCSLEGSFHLFALTLLQSLSMCLTLELTLGCWAWHTFHSFHTKIISY